MFKLFFNILIGKRCKFFKIIGEGYDREIVKYESNIGEEFEVF